MSIKPGSVFNHKSNDLQHSESTQGRTLLELLSGVKAERVIFQIMTVIVLGMGTFVILLPIAFMFGSSLKDKAQLKMFPPPILPYAYTTAEVNGETYLLYDATTEQGTMQLALVKKAPGGMGFFVDPKDPTVQYKLVIKEQTQLKHLAGYTILTLHP